jgi:16S rRNA (guanine527-N7)-methyltransferase
MAPPSVSRETLARGLSAAQRRRLDAVLAALESDEHAPTTIREPDRAAELHLADSLSALELDVLRDGGRIVDLGSGAGFPGVPLAVALPDADVTLVESQRRRCEFLERMCAAAGIENVRVAWTRAEAWTEGRSRQDVALARALASQPVVLEYAAPLLRVGGKLIDWRGRRSPEQERTADRAASTLGLRRLEVRRVVPFAGASDHHLHVFEKLQATPAGFPRRPGIARKRPLGD